MKDGFRISNLSERFAAKRLPRITVEVQCEPTGCWEQENDPGGRWRARSLVGWNFVAVCREIELLISRGWMKVDAGAEPVFIGDDDVDVVVTIVNAERAREVVSGNAATREALLMATLDGG